MKRSLRSIVLKCPGCDTGISLANRVACASCLTPYHEECFLAGGECALEGCSGREVVERGGVNRTLRPPPAPEPAEPEDEPAPAKPPGPAKLDYVSTRETVLGAILTAAVCRYTVPPIYAATRDHAWVTFTHLMPAMLAAVAFKIAVLDDHWEIDARERVIRTSRRFLVWSSVKPFLAFDDLLEMRATRRLVRNRRGEVVPTFTYYALVKRDGGIVEITHAHFEDPRSQSIRTKHQVMGDLADLLGIPLREIIDPGSR